MPRFSMEVQCHFGGFSYANVEVDAEDFAEAQDKVMHMAKESSNELTWLEGQQYGQRYEINRNECRAL